MPLIILPGQSNSVPTDYHAQLNKHHWAYPYIVTALVQQGGKLVDLSKGVSRKTSYGVPSPVYNKQWGPGTNYTSTSGDEFIKDITVNQNTGAIFGIVTPRELAVKYLLSTSVTSVKIDTTTTQITAALNNGLSYSGAALAVDTPICIGYTADRYAALGGGATNYLFINGEAASTDGASTLSNALPISRVGAGGLFRGSGLESSSYTDVHVFLILSGIAPSAAQHKELFDNPWKLFTGRPRRLYFDVPAGGQTIAVGQSSETDTAQALSRIKRAALAQIAETDAAQAITAAKRRAVGQATETDTAQPITQPGEQIVAVGQAAETEFAQAIAHYKRLGVLQPAESDSAQPISISKRRAVGQASEADTAQPIGRPGSQTISLGMATETDIALPISRRILSIARMMTAAAESARSPATGSARRPASLSTSRR